MDINEIECIAVVGYMNEDELPVWVDEEIYKRIYHSSSIVDGCRMFPYISLCRKRIFLMIPPPECRVELPKVAEQVQPTTIPNKCAFIKLDIKLAQKHLEDLKNKVEDIESMYGNLSCRGNEKGGEIFSV